MECVHCRDDLDSGRVMTPEQAFKRLQEWVSEHSKALAGISAVEAVRKTRESR
jgi:hypothetical protein